MFCWEYRGWTCGIFKGTHGLALYQLYVASWTTPTSIWVSNSHFVIKGIFNFHGEYYLFLGLLIPSVFILVPLRAFNLTFNSYNQLCYVNHKANLMPFKVFHTLYFKIFIRSPIFIPTLNNTIFCNYFVNCFFHWIFKLS